MRRNIRLKAQLYVDFAAQKMDVRRLKMFRMFHHLFIERYGPLLIL